MNKNSKQVLENIFDTLEISDKEFYSQYFIALCQKQSIINLINSLPPEKRPIVLEQLSISNDPDVITQKLLENFTQEEIVQSLEDASKIAFSDFLDNLKKHLDPSQLEKLKEIVPQII